MKTPKTVEQLYQFSNNLFDNHEFVGRVHMLDNGKFETESGQEVIPILYVLGFMEKPGWDDDEISRWNLKLIEKSWEEIKGYADKGLKTIVWRRLPQLKTRDEFHGRHMISMRLAFA